MEMMVGMDFALDLWNFLAGLIGFISFGLAVYFQNKNRVLKREKESLTWSDIRIAVDDLVRELKKDNYIPDYIYSPRCPGGIIGHIISELLGGDIPVFVGDTVSNKSTNITEWDFYEYIETSKWHIGIPKLLISARGKKILIVDDFTMSGDAIREISTIIRNGNKISDIRSYTVMVTDMAVQGNKAPYYYWKTVESTRFYFPWGVAK
ncbi:hypothetical protein H2659_18285 [Vibrio cholerae]